MGQALLPVAFDGDTLDLINHQDQPFVACKPIATALGLDWSSQRQRLDAMRPRWGVVEITIPTAGGMQASLTMPLRKLPAWLYSIKPGKVAPHVRPKLERYQAECDEVLWRHWSGQTAAAQPPAGIARIEQHMEAMAGHMADLTRISVQQAAKLEVTARYIELLEVNQRGHAKVTPEVEKAVLELKAQGMPQTSIARLLRISGGTVSLLVNGKYPRNASYDAEPPKPTLAQALDSIAEHEAARQLGEGGVS